MNFYNTHEAAQFLAKELKNNPRGVILLEGEMGAGKTTLITEVLRILDPKIKVSSPTFAIINQYTDSIFHADLYRIKCESELENIGFWEIVAGDNLIFVEWGSKLGQKLAKMGCLSVKIGGSGAQKRHVCIEKRGG